MTFVRCRQFGYHGFWVSIRLNLIDAKGWCGSFNFFGINGPGHGSLHYLRADYKFSRSERTADQQANGWTKGLSGPVQGDYYIQLQKAIHEGRLIAVSGNMALANKPSNLVQSTNSWQPLALGIAQPHPIWLNRHFPVTHGCALFCKWILWHYWMRQF